MMSKTFFRRAWPVVLGLVLAGTPGGCDNPNENDAEGGIKGTKGVADPKYAAGTPDQYKQFFKDTTTKEVPGKGKGGGSKAR